MATQPKYSVEEELRTSPLAAFQDNLILSTASDEFIVHVWEPKTLALLHSYQVFLLFSKC